jgi:hypothetical protein
MLEDNLVAVPPEEKPSAIRERLAHKEAERLAALVAANHGREVKIGSFVRIDGLASRADLNGTEGVALLYDETKGRFGVRPHTETAPLALKPINLSVTGTSTLTSYTEPLDIAHGHLRIRAVRDPIGWSHRNLGVPGRQLHTIVEDLMAEPLAAPHQHGISPISDGQLDRWGTRALQLDQPPFIAISTRDWWAVMVSKMPNGVDFRVDSTLLPAPSPELESERQVRMDTIEVDASLSLLLAAAEVSDLRVAKSVFVVAMNGAMQLGRFVELGAATEALLPVLEAAEHPARAQDIGYYGCSCGEAFEAAATAGNAASWGRAVSAYRWAAECASRPGARVCSGHGEHLWNCLGVCLKRCGKFDAAERAYRWGICWGIGCGRSKAATLAQIHKNMRTLQEARKLPAAQVALGNQEIVASMVAQMAVDGMAGTTARCASCGAMGTAMLLQRCTGCKNVYYCGPQCQQGHWSQHKKACELAQQQGSVIGLS